MGFGAGFSIPWPFEDFEINAGHFHVFGFGAGLSIRLSMAVWE